MFWFTPMKTTQSSTGGCYPCSHALRSDRCLRFRWSRERRGEIGREAVKGRGTRMSGGGGGGGGGGAAMSATWRDDDEEFKPGGVKGGRSKPRFTFSEVKLLLEAVKRNRYIILRKFNQGVSAESKKQTWAEITNQINELGENRREVRQIMKKWADLKCDGKRRIIALRGPNGSTLRKKHMGPVERMVHKILMMTPSGDGNSDPDLEDDDLSKLDSKGGALNPPCYSYLGLTDASYPLGGGVPFEISPLSSPEKDLPGDPFSSDLDFDQADDGERTMDCDKNDNSVISSSVPPSSSSPTSLDPLPDGALQRIKPVHTYSRNNGNQNPASSRPPSGPSTSSAALSSNNTDGAPSPPFSNGTASSLPPDSSSAPPPASDCQPSTSSIPQPPAPSTSSIPPPPAPSTSSIPPPPAPSITASTSSAAPNDVSGLFSNSKQTSSPSSFSTPVLPLKRPSASSDSHPSDPLPAGASSGATRDHLAQMASQSVQQQRSCRVLLASASRSLEALGQSVQLLVESQQEFVQESLLLQRETVEVLKDFSNTALMMLRDKASGGQRVSHQLQHPHPASRF